MIDTISYWCLAVALCFGGAAVFSEVVFRYVDRWVPRDRPRPFDQERE